MYYALLYIRESPRDICIRYNLQVPLSPFPSWIIHTDPTGTNTNHASLWNPAVNFAVFLCLCACLTNELWNPKRTEQWIFSIFHCIAIKGGERKLSILFLLLLSKIILFNGQGNYSSLCSLKAVSLLLLFVLVGDVVLSIKSN